MKAVKKFLFVVGCAALTVGVGWMGVSGVFSICADASLWKSGTSARDVRVDGKVSTRKFLNTYDFNVKYRDAAGKPHEGKSHFMSFTSIDDKKTPEVHYDPKDPDRFSLSWSQDVPGGRWSAAVLFVLCIPFFGAATVAIAREKQPAPPPPAAP